MEKEKIEKGEERNLRKRRREKEKKKIGEEIVVGKRTGGNRRSTRGPRTPMKMENWRGIFPCSSVRENVCVGGKAKTFTITSLPLL